MNKTKKLIIKAKKDIFSEKSGHNSSIFKGEGYDFVELRDYQIGDDIRKIDWNITAKLNSPHIKIFQEEREINVVTASILSGSVYFGGHNLKQDIIAEVVSFLGFSAVKNMDLFSSFIFSEDKVFFQQPSKHYFGVEKAVDNIFNFYSAGKNIEPQVVIDSLIKKVKKRSLIFIISDFYKEYDFKYLSKHSEVIAIIIRDRIEENPENLGFSTIVDSETGQRLQSFSENINSYRQNLENHDSKMLKEFKKRGVRTLKIYTDDNIFKSLRKFFR